MRLVVLMVVASVFSAASASAQTCKGNDALSSARRARRALEDVDTSNAEVDGDLSRLKEAQALWPSARADHWAYASAVGEMDYFMSFPTCTTAGLQAGSLGRTRAGVMVGYDRKDMGFRVHYIGSSDQLLVSDPRTGELDANAPRKPEGARLSFGQRVVGGSLTLSRWARIELEQVSTFAPRSTASFPSGIAVSDPGAVESGEDRLLGALSIPALHLGSHALTDTGTGALEVASVGSTRLPIAHTGLLATIGTSYFADERQVTTLAGLTYQGWYRRHGQRRPLTVRTSDSVVREGTGFELGGEASGEYGSGRLRHTRVRAETFAVGSRAYPASVWHGPTYVKAGAFAEATSFGSAHFTEQTGRANVLGGGGGVHAGFGTRMVSMHVEAYGGANRPEALARVSEVATRGEFKGQLYVRSGW